MITTIFLDNDGVLADTEKLYFEANQVTCRKHGYELSPTEYRRLFLESGNGLREVGDRLGWPPHKLADVRAERDALYGDLLATRDITLPGVSDGLRRLSERFSLCIVTSSPRRFFETIHRRTGFGRFFKTVLSEEQVQKHKPDPDPYLRALEAMKTAPAQGVAVEDSARGLRSAAGAGLRCIIVPRPLTQDQDFSAALSVELTFLDAVAFIERIADS
jgi:HAD superfamily hydrolase (TIGR01509 family)